MAIEDLRADATAAVDAAYALGQSQSTGGADPIDTLWTIADENGLVKRGNDMYVYLVSFYGEDGAKKACEDKADWCRTSGGKPNAQAVKIPLVPVS